MAAFTNHTTITGRQIKVRPNYRKRHFTIITDSGKYRTLKMDSEEFNSCLWNTGNDWNQFLKSDSYYLVKK